MKKQSTLVGAAGEHYVMYRLLRMGYIAALAPKGVPNSDLIVTDVNGKLTAVIQVKTKGVKKSNDGWHLNQKHENISSETLFYCFVDDTFDKPIVYVVPSSVVADTVKESHRVWLSLPGKNNQVHKDVSMRWLLPDYSKTLKADHSFVHSHGLGWLEQYKEKWSLLSLDTK